MNIGFKSLHPITAFIFFVFAFIFCLSATNPVILVIVFMSGFIYDLKLQRKKAIFFVIKFILPFVVLITVFNGLFSHYGVTVLFTMPNGNSFTLEAIVYGFISAIRIAGMLLWLNCFNEIVTSDKIIYLFGRFSPKTALIISMVLRFIPLIRNQSAEITKAEKGIGNAAVSHSFIIKIKSVSRRLSILISWTLEKGIDTSDSMRARGYGLKGRTSYSAYIFSLTDISAILFSFSALVMNFVFADKLSCSYNPIIAIPPFNILSVVLVFVYTSILMMPLIYDLWEEKRWSISESAI